ncbi:MAG: sensor histidine kinase [Xanthobacteraceae bacterium]
MPAKPASVVVIAPFRQDASHLRLLLKNEGVDVKTVQEGELPQLLCDLDLMVLTQEALTPTFVESLIVFAREQPAWSDVPVIAITDTQTRTLAFLKNLQSRLSDHSLTVLHRPLRKGELLSAVHFALGARRRQLELRDHLAFQEQLKRELSHRVKNILANVSALFFMTLKQSQGLDDFVRAFKGRLDALARVHGLLVGTDWTQSDLGAVAENVLTPYRDAEGTRVQISGPQQMLGPDSAVGLALAFHELATNAAKYGALSNDEGRLSLSWSFADRNEPVLEIVWRECGGPPVRVPERSGFGTTFIRSVIEKTLDGEIEADWREQGLVFRLRIPQSALVPE